VLHVRRLVLRSAPFGACCADAHHGRQLGAPDGSGNRRTVDRITVPGKPLKAWDSAGSTCPRKYYLATGRTPASHYRYHEHNVITVGAFVGTTGKSDTSGPAGSSDLLQP